MKTRFLFGSIIGLLATLPAFAQIDQQAAQLTHYVLPEFTAGKVLMKNGSSTQQTLNYNVLTNEMIFDAGGGKYMAIAEPATVDTVFIGDRKFIPARTGFVELLYKGSVPLAVVYEGRIVQQGNDVGFGMTSQTGANQSIRTMVQNGSAYGMKLPDGFEVTLLKAYGTLKDGNWEKFNNFAALGKLVPAKKAVISETVKSGKLDVKNKADLLALFKAINE